MKNSIEKPLCIIPARGGSKRLPRKNIALLGGKPLLGWTIDAARESGIFDVVRVSTEDTEMMAIAEQYGAEVFKRPLELAGDRVALNELCRHVVREILSKHPDYTALYLLLPTSPFRTSGTIRRAWQAFVESGADGLLSVEPVPHPPQWALCETDGWLATLFPDQYDLQRQKLRPALRHDGGHSITRMSHFLDHGTILGPKTLAFSAPVEERLDIDEPADLELANFRLMKKAP